MSNNGSEYELRKIEILDAARELFFEQGYEKTPVQDIAERAGIAKGTFYYYFNSKQDLLKALIDQLIDKEINSCKKIIKNDKLTSVEKLNFLLLRIFSWKTKKSSIFPVYFPERNNNIQFWHNMKNRFIEKMKPCLINLIESGTKEGVFRVEYREEVSEIIFNLLFDLMESLAVLLKEMPLNQRKAREIKRKISAFKDSLERILGLSPGSLNLFDKQVL